MKCIERTESPLEYFLRSARSLGVSKGELVGHGFVAYWQCPVETVVKKSSITREEVQKADPVDSKVYDDYYKEAPAVGLFYKAVPNQFLVRSFGDEEVRHRRYINFQLNGRFDANLIHVPGSTKPYDSQTAPAKDPFALVSKGELSHESLYFGFGFSVLDDVTWQNIIAESYLVVQIKDGLVVDAPHATGLLDDTKRTIRSVIGDQIPLSYKPVVDWMLAAYKGPDLPKLEYEQLVSPK